MKQQFDSKVKEAVTEVGFSGTILVQKNGEVIHESAYGFANRSDQLKNTVHTRFGIASGCKLFTAISTGILVDEGKITFDTRLKDCLDIQFSNFSDEITIHHLLSHTSGIPDYFDESVMDDFEELWKTRPMYSMRELKDFLPMFQHRDMMFQPGSQFHYNNAGFIVLGLVIEQLAGMSFTDFVEQKVFARAGMKDSGYFSLDQLPANTAIGYIDDVASGTWKSNMYSIPIKGGADGGAFITVHDMVRLFDALFSKKLLTESTTERLLSVQAEGEDDEFYGYGIWMDKQADEITKHHVMGYDPGVSFHAAVYANGVEVVIASNKSEGAYSIMVAIEELLD
ncbi:serine hydrolase [Ornithinibacillus sp. BX22]|uniref:Serine hydrolase n=1 Tax=Ornithinibacillus hominis TaxID=2763055 RepID=A0A923L5L0_9BACI|nr:serine hydrolase domain-containing protein [Ornithinibacillus hominis]MBC5636884.1 serine hydrolase [Ornithinibacillus hominis]